MTSGAPETTGRPAEALLRSASTRPEYDLFSPRASARGHEGYRTLPEALQHFVAEAAGEIQPAGANNTNVGISGEGNEDIHVYCYNIVSVRDIQCTSRCRQEPSAWVLIHIC